MTMNKRHRQLLLLFSLVLLHVFFMVFPGFFAPYDYSEQNRELPFAPPTRLHFIDSAGGFHLMPFVHPFRPNEDGAPYVEDQARVYPLHLLKNGAPYRVLGLWTARLHLFGVEQPGHVFLFGTDDFGRDELSRMLFGGRFRCWPVFLARQWRFLQVQHWGCSPVFMGDGLTRSL